MKPSSTQYKSTRKAKHPKKMRNRALSGGFLLNDDLMKYCLACPVTANCPQQLENHNPGIERRKEISSACLPVHTLCISCVQPRDRSPKAGARRRRFNVMLLNRNIHGLTNAIRSRVSHLWRHRMEIH